MSPRLDTLLPWTPWPKPMTWAAWSVNSEARSGVVRSIAAAPSVMPEQSRSVRGGATTGEPMILSIVNSFWKWA